MQLHGWEAVLFYLLAIMTLFMAVFVVTARVTIHSALFLIGTLVNIALLFILLRAEFVAGVQILVYVGGVMVLFLFVIMLVQTRAEEEARVALYTGQTWPAVAIALLLAVSFYFAMNPAQAAFRPPESSAAAAAGAEGGEISKAGAGYVSKDTQEVGEQLYRQAALPFEVASLLLLVAMVGAVLLARGAKQQKYYE
ncbi:MAG TPA: NADH-quinone oxidoreductase subunit J [Blastocatellia bacterium]|jgi:NADH-quinone oxidoreductase subunit J|nr:NADH-quinone oxidoreductase subunit J [Blastocatellia bacterium]